jgi:hypothetical protein
MKGSELNPSVQPYRHDIVRAAKWQCTLQVLYLNVGSFDDVPLAKACDLPAAEHSTIKRLVKKCGFLWQRFAADNQDIVGLKGRPP